MSESHQEILRGTLDLLILKTLETIGPLHGWGIAKRIEQVSADVLNLNQGTIYPALVRLEQKGWIAAEWGVSSNRRRAKFYSLTQAGKKQIQVETAQWEQMAAIVARVLAGAS